MSKKILIAYYTFEKNVTEVRKLHDLLTSRGYIITPVNDSDYIYAENAELDVDIATDCRSFIIVGGLRKYPVWAEWSSSRMGYVHGHYTLDIPPFYIPDFKIEFDRMNNVKRDERIILDRDFWNVPPPLTGS